MEIKEQIIVLVKSKKSKTINIKEIRENLNLEYTPQNEKILKNEIEKLVQERYIEPQKTSKTNVEGISEKYKIIKQDDANIKQEIINLSNKLKIDYYLKNTKEYQKDKEIINSISKFISKPIEGVLTINERSYQIFQNEKLLKEREDIIKKLGLTLQDLKCYETYEPFFYYENKEFSKGKILIIENKDTFWTIQNVVKTTKYKNIYLVIYGEGKKILKSFEFINNFKLENNIIEYFGDIDYEGINIYEQLKSKYSQYNIKAYKTGYQKILDIEKNPNKIRANQICNLKNNEEKHLKDSKSIINQSEADIATSIAKFYLGTGINPKDIGIISPYADQVNLIQDKIPIEVKSVDGFQGREKEIIIISTVRSNKNKDIGFLKDLRRLNVAITRAKRKLIVIGNKNTLKGNSTYSKLIKFCAKNDLLINFRHT